MFGRPSSLCFQHWAGLVILSFCLNKQPAAPTGPLVEDVFWYPQKIFPFPFVFAFLFSFQFYSFHARQQHAICKCSMGRVAKLYVDGSQFTLEGQVWEGESE